MTLDIPDPFKSKTKEFFSREGAAGGAEIFCLLMRG